MLDRTSWGVTSDRKNPEEKKGEDIPIIQIQKEELYIGGAGNVARNLTSLGVSCDFYGIIGDDMYGRELIRICHKEKIGIENLRLTEFPTILKARHFVDGEYKERNDIGEKDENGRSLLKKIDKNLEERFLISFKNKCKIKRDYNGIILSDYNKHIFSKSFSKGIIEIAQKHGLPIFADVKPENLDFFKGCTLICPNAEEASKITGIEYSKQNLNEIGRIIQEKINSKYAIITCSEDGAFVYYNGKSRLIKTQARKVEEVTGAGDTFISLLMASYASRLNIYDSVELANYASGIVVEKSGTSTVSPEELEKRVGKDKF
jgi:D-beta-D-heptose 7-phosphate kinase/D-beta-D-heptose 1-phosphate adenosyltransferase